MEKSQKKWSLGSILFRKNKKQIPQADFSSDEDDLKAGFNDDFVKKSPSKVKTSKQFAPNYGQSVPDLEFHYYRPTLAQHEQPINRSPKYYTNQNHVDYLNNHINIEKNRVAVQPRHIYNNDVNQYQGSSQDEKSSYNSLSSPLNKAGSESGSRTSLTKKTRNARNERYYQRIMRDDGRPLTIYGNVENQNYRPPLNGANNRLSASFKSSSLCSSDFMLPVSHQSQSLPASRHRYHSDFDKDDYENIHEVDESQPPPIPPRDPNRRFSVNASISQQPYYFDPALQKYVIFNTSGRCFSDDRLCRNESEISRDRLISKAGQQEANVTKQHDILKPRSRKPINLHTNLDNESVMNTGDVVDNSQMPASQNKRSRSAVDFMKLINEPVGSKYSGAARQRNLTSVEPIKFQMPQDSRAATKVENNNEALRKKYSSAEDVNKARQLMANAITPSSRKSFNAMDLKEKTGVSSNLDDAINELELMYKSLVNSESVVIKRDLPTPTKFAQMMRKFEEYEDEDNKNDKEPDILLDDVFSRNLKYANQKLKPLDPLPFGIPNTKLCPIPPKASHDYLSVEPQQTRKAVIAAQNNPDVIADDLAVRNLRKDTPSYGRRRNLIEVDNNQFVKRNHTLSSFSEHVFNEILKDSAKPAGGKLEDYLQLDPIKAKQPPIQRDVEFEDSLNALMVESKAMKQKLEKDLSNLKRETASPRRKTLVNLLDFSQEIEKAKELKALSTENLAKEIAKPKPVAMTSTACSPIKQFDTYSPIRELGRITAQPAQVKLPPTQIKSPVAQVKSPVKAREPSLSPPKQQKAEKIENLIKMFNKNMSPEPVKKTATAASEKPTRNVSNLAGRFNREKSIEKPVASPPTASVKIVSPTRMNPRLVSPKIPTPVEEKKPQVDVESNINHIKQLIEQIKQTDLDECKRVGALPLVAKTVDSDLPDYDNIKDDYEMTDGRLERITELKIDSPKLPRAAMSQECVSDQRSTSSSAFRETSVESSTKSSKSSKSDHFEEATAMYEDAIRFSNEKAAETKAAKEIAKAEVEPARKQPEAEAKKEVEIPSLKTTKISIVSRTIEAAPQPVATPPSPQAKIVPIIPPEADNDSLYNSSEELAMIFGIEKQPPTDVPIQAGKPPPVVDDDLDAQFDQIVHDNEIADDLLLDDNFKVSLTDLNTATDKLYDECFNNNEFSEETPTPERAMSTTEETPLEKSDSNNNIATTDLSKLSEDLTSRVVNRRVPPGSSDGTGPCISTDATFNPQANLKKQSLFLAFVYCIMLYLQFITLNFKSS